MEMAIVTGRCDYCGWDLASFMESRDEMGNWNIYRE